ncbi:MAG: sugar phosphate isomerase/epimerase [Polyangiaceae bacterium]|nr:sugar phosphate isomerase/epimerase [Polyangiaceae bacterium]
MKLGLKLGTRNFGYTDEALRLYDKGCFSYIELFVIPGSFDETVSYWKHFSVPMIIHAPHSYGGMNLSQARDRENNEKVLSETFKFADALQSEYIIFHAGVNGSMEETVSQLRPFSDSRCLIENKPLKGINGEKCLGATPEDVRRVMDELNAGICLDFGHAICAANTLSREPVGFIREFLPLGPSVYHLTDGDFESERDMHLHYGDGSFPLKTLLRMIPDDAMVTNEAKHDSDTDLNDFEKDSLYVKNI